MENDYGKLPHGVTRTTPLRLRDAVEIAFPLSGLTVSGLRKEIARGKLEVEMVAGKQYVTLEAIDRMRELCRIPVKAKREDDANSARLSAARDAALLRVEQLRTTSKKK